MTERSPRFENTFTRREHCSPGAAAPPHRQTIRRHPDDPDALLRSKGIPMYTRNINVWLTTAREPEVVRRALGCALVVGVVLATINHGPCIMHGEFNRMCLMQAAMTMTVPYFVSTYSSVLAIMNAESARPPSDRPANIQTSQRNV